jgi:2,3-bisphosphoglycerate-dependent phosphoglycerate mutase
MDQGWAVACGGGKIDGGKCDMTTIYFVRHCESDTSIRDDRIRPLTTKGLADRELVTAFLQDKGIDVVLSSPYRRAYDTISDFANKAGLQIHGVEDFRERKAGNVWLPDDEFWQYIRRKWSDFSYKLADGESLAEVQERNIAALNDVLDKYKDKNIVIGTHGTALSTIINYYDCTYDFADFMAMVNIMPWVARMVFNDTDCAAIEKIDLFRPVLEPEWDKCRVTTTDLGALRSYIFIVVFASYQGKWLYCRAKTRDSFETAGGHIEDGETPLEAAKREFYEETGAVSFDITPAFDYKVRFPNVYSNGQVFIAEINELGNMPDYEMAEVKLFDTIPDKMRFPQILPILYEKVRELQ